MKQDRLEDHFFDGRKISPVASAGSQNLILPPPTGMAKFPKSQAPRKMPDLAKMVEMLHSSDSKYPITN